MAATGRPGPVLIDFVKNVTFPNVEIDYEFVPWTEPINVNVDNFGLAGEGVGLEGHPVGEPAAHGDEQVALVARGNRL